MMTRHFGLMISALLVSLCIFTLAPRQASAAGTGQKLGFVDMEAVSKKSSVVAGIRDKVEKSAAEKRAGLETKMDELDRLTLELKRKESVLSDAEATSMKDKIRTLRNSIADEKDKMNEMLQKAEKEQLNPAFDKIIEMIRQIGTEEGYDMILPGEVVLYGNPGTDLTNKVIERLNSQNSGAGAGAKSDGVAAEVTPKAGAAGADAEKAGDASGAGAAADKKVAPAKKSLFRKAK